MFCGHGFAVFLAVSAVIIGVRAEYPSLPRLVVVFISLSEFCHHVRRRQRRSRLMMMMVVVVSPSLLVNSGCPAGSGELS